MEPAIESRSTSLPEIVKVPEIVGGEPIVAGTRVPVRSIVILLEAYGEPCDVYRALPTLPPGGVEAAMAYYATHRDEIERYIALHESDSWGRE